jgi:hypothetical protein
MSNPQIFGVRIAFLVLGWIVGYVLFGPAAEWLFGWPVFIWCGFAGMIIGFLIGGEPNKN